MKLMSSLTRFRILLLLLIYPKLSLSEFSNLLGRTKSTVHHHLKKFENLEILSTSRKPVPSYIDAKIYELKPDFLKIINLKFEDFKTFSEKEKKTILPYILSKDIEIFEVIKNLFEQVVLLYKTIDKAGINNDQNSSKEYSNFYLRSPIKYDIWFLNKEEFELYNECILDFKNKLNKMHKEDINQNKNDRKPFLILNSIFPMEKLLKYDSETKKFVKFYKALE
jgi:DNA-binding transcriptional ArsR family regulator